MTKPKGKPSPSPGPPKTAAQRELERFEALHVTARLWAARAIKELGCEEVAMYVLRAAANKIQKGTSLYAAGHRPRKKKRKR